MLDFFLNSSMITQLVGLLLFFSLFLVFFIGISKFITLYNWLKLEKESLDSMIVSQNMTLNGSSFLYGCSGNNSKKRVLKSCYLKAERESTKGLTILSIFATTSPFLGLFGTVVGILEAFSTFSDGVTLATIAPAISEALIATAMGILVAIPAYGTQLTLKRKSYEICSTIQSQIELIENKESSNT